VKLRSATTEDISAIDGIRRKVILADAAGLYFLEQIEGWTCGEDQTARCAPSIAAGYVFVAEDDTGRILGFGNFDHDSAVIEAICVDIPHQGHGIGRMLVRESLIRARKRQLSNVNVNAFRDTIEFYERLAFEAGAPGHHILPDGTGVEVVSMSRPVKLPFIQERIASLEETIRFFGAGPDNQQAQERIVVEGFLRGLGVEFSASEIKTVNQGPPDAIFRDATFEVKELYPPERRRHDEYKLELAKAREAFWAEELFEQFSPVDISLQEVVDQVSALALKYASQYAPAVRAGLDLLVYANLHHVWGITEGQFPDLSVLQNCGWRSVSFFRGSATSCVLAADAKAPQFVRAAVGRLHHGDTRRDGVGEPC